MSDRPSEATVERVIQAALNRAALTLQDPVPVFVRALAEAGFSVVRTQEQEGLSEEDVDTLQAGIGWLEDHTSIRASDGLREWLARLASAVGETGGEDG